MIIANTPAAIGAEKSSVHIFSADGQWTTLPFSNKAVVAKKIINVILDAL